MIEGMKLSNELFLVNIEDPASSGLMRFQLFKKIAIKGISLFFLSGSFAGDQGRTSFCVGAENGNLIRDLVLSEPGMGRGAEFIPAVGALSLFPHQFSLKILSLAAKAFGETHLPFYGMTTSISSLTFITDYDTLDRAADIMEKYLSVSPDHTPPRRILRMRQTL